MSAGEPGVDVGAELDQRGDDGGAVRKVTRPVGRDMEQRARHAVRPGVAEPHGCEVRVLLQQAPQRLDVTGVNRLDRRGCPRFVRTEVQTLTVE